MVNQLFYTDTTNSAVDNAFLKINQQTNNRRHLLATCIHFIKCTVAYGEMVTGNRAVFLVRGAVTYCNYVASMVVQ
jgi:hypothetical protein